MNCNMVAGPAAADMGGRGEIFDRVVAPVDVFGAARGGFAGAVCEPADHGQAAGGSTRAGGGCAAAAGRSKIKNQLQLFLPATAVAPFAALMADVGPVVDRDLIAGRGRSS
jgi:hypothetical protein